MRGIVSATGRPEGCPSTEPADRFDSRSDVPATLEPHRPANERQQDPAPASSPRRARGPSGAILAFFVGLSLLVGVGAAAFYLVTTRSAGSLSDRVAAALARVTQARVNVEANTVTLDTRDIAELALVSRRIQTLVKYESAFLGSDSVLILRGEFDVKAGFDLTEPFELSVDSATGSVVGEFPPARILGVELRDYDVFHAKEGLWNKLTPETQESVTRQLLDQARRDAERSDIVREAEARLATRLQDLLDGADTTVRIGGRLQSPTVAGEAPEL